LQCRVPKIGLESSSVIFSIILALHISDCLWRPVCEHRRIAEEWNHVLDVINESILMNNLPSINHRRNLLDDFLEHHAWYLQRAICYSMRWLQLEETFDFSKSHMLIYLRYRPDCEDNPGVAFHITDMVFRPFSQTIAEYARAGPMLEAHRRHYQVKVAALKASDPDCMGALSIACMMEDQCVWMTFPYCLTPPEFLPFERDLQQRLGACWLEDLQRVVHMGLGYRKDAEGHLWRLGTLKKRKQEWCWQRLSQDSLVSFGYSRDHALGY
jgi:hypothetical protein